MAAAVSTSPTSTAPRQNWILGGIADHLLIIVAPILGLLWGMGTYRLAGGGVNGQVVVVGVFMIFNVAHHFPTFIRIYGDASLIRRFRWSLLLAPLLVFGASVVLCSYLVFVKKYPIQYIVYLSIILTIWDPWHFLMQHYGFVRIYDRHNHAPRRIAARMDYWMCATWFTFCMIAATGWLPNLIYDIYHHFGVPLLFMLNGTLFQALWMLSLAAAVAMTAVYLLYLGWCRRHGYYVSRAKLLLLLITFTVMYLTYAPNPLMQQWVPGWTFSMGFAVIGMVHVSQYLAIVWKYNRSLARREGAARTPLFSRLFGSRGAMLLGVMAGYVVICLLYGSFLTDYGHRFWFPTLGIAGGDFALYLVIVLGSLVFTSTLTHYYFDGFIWKVRHKENRDNLAMSDEKTKTDSPQDSAAQSRQGESWFSSADTETAGRVILRQSGYFLLPMGLLTVLFWTARDNTAEKLPIAVMRISAESTSSAAQEQGREGMRLADDQLEIEKQMIDLRPLGMHHCYVADLLFERTMCELYWDKVSLGRPLAITADDMVRLRPSLLAARENYKRALQLPPPYSHREESVLLRDSGRAAIDRQYMSSRIDEIDELLSAAGS